MAEDEATLLDRWCAGDPVAGNQLLKLHFESVYRFFLNKVESEVDELVQQTFLACLAQRDAFRRESSFRTFLFSIARNRLYSYWRQRSRRGLPLDFEECTVASLSTSVGTRLGRKHDRDRLHAALRGLPVDQQLLLELHYWEGLEGEQLAEVFGIAPATVRSRLFRARQTLRTQLDDGGASPPAASEDALDDWARRLRPDIP